jgi:ribosomal protein S27E
MGLEKNRTTLYTAPCLVSFEEVVDVVNGIARVTGRALFTFYLGQGKVALVKLNDVPREFGIPLIKALADSSAGLKSRCPDVFPVDWSCPGPNPDAAPCGNKEVEVTIDRRLDGFAILRLRCRKCNTETTVDVMAKDPRLLCENCGEARNDVLLANDGDKKVRLCEACFEKRNAPGKEEAK